MTANMPTGTVTFLFTDIEGSTRLLHRLGVAYGRIQAEHQALLRQSFLAHDGVEVDTQGDSFFVAFPTAPAAVAAAAAATRALAAHSWPEGASVRVRMGIHTGAPQRIGDHYFGLDVNRAARIAAAGHGGQILLSATTCALIEQALPDGATLRDLGVYRLKDLRYPEHITQLALAGLPTEFPLLKTLDRQANNLPIQANPLLGREEPVASLYALLTRGAARLITLTGVGGIGKTRLALQVAAEALEHFPDGVWFVRLSRIVDPEQTLPTIAHTLAVEEIMGEPIAQTLQEFLREKQVLLVLDNFEQIVAAATEVGELLAHSPGLKALVTSRVPLRLSGEREYPLAPLPLPAPGGALSPERLTQYAAVALFVERASAAQPTFMVTAANAPTIAEICARLDGLPLALELAATRVKLLSPEALLARLSSQLRLLTGGARDLEARQQTMRATIAWSVALLHPAEQTLFRRLAVFVGGAALEAAEAVCWSPGDRGAEQQAEQGMNHEVAPLDVDALDGLGALVDQSLVQQRDEGGPRFGMLHVIREYALEQLQASGEAEALRRAHAAYFLQVAEQASPFLDGPEQMRALPLLGRDHHNLRAALEWWLEQGEVETFARFVLAIGEFWVTRGHWNEGRQWITKALEAGDALSTRLHARLLAREGHLARAQGDFITAERQLSRSLALSRGEDDQAGVVDVLCELAGCALLQEQFTKAQQLVDEAVTLCKTANYLGGLHFARSIQSNLAEAHHDYLGARRWLTEWLDLSQQINDPHNIAQAKRDNGWFALLLGGGKTAEDQIREVLAIHRQMSDTNCSAIALGFLGMAALERDDIEAAQELLAQSLAFFESITKKPAVAVGYIYLGIARFAAGSTNEAEAAYLAGLRIAQGLWSRRTLAAGLTGLAEIAQTQGRSEQAARFLNAAMRALRLVDAAPLALPPRLAARREQFATRVRQAVGEAHWQALLASEREGLLEDALGEAFAHFS